MSPPPLPGPAGNRRWGDACISCGIGKALELLTLLWRCAIEEGLACALLRERRLNIQKGGRHCSSADPQSGRDVSREFVVRIEGWETCARPRRQSGSRFWPRAPYAPLAASRPRR